MKTNNMKFEKTIVRANGENLIIKIRLNDECKNGHQDFAITGELYKGSGRSDRNMISAGCIHDEILKAAPEFEPFVKLHLCDYNGVPMHAIANGHYHMKNGFNDKTVDHKEKFCEYYRVTPEQYDTLKGAKDQNYFGFLLVKLGVLDQWKAEAQAAIKTLESLTGDEFINDSEKSNFQMNTEMIDLIEEKVKEGFYTPENIEQREAEKKQAKLDKDVTYLEEKYKSDCNKLLLDFEKNKLLLQLFGTSDNVIFYNHINTIVFNWSGSDYNTVYTPEQVAEFAEKYRALDSIKDLVKDTSIKIGKK